MPLSSTVPYARPISTRPWMLKPIRDGRKNALLAEYLLQLLCGRSERIRTVRTPDYEAPAATVRF